MSRDEREQPRGGAQAPGASLGLAAGTAVSGMAAGAAASSPAAAGTADHLCDYLRAKVSSGAHGDKRALLRVRDDASSIYWCLLTMSPVGPDDGFVHADRCSRSRECCVQDTEPGVS